MTFITCKYDDCNFGVENQDFEIWLHSIEKSLIIQNWPKWKITWITTGRSRQIYFEYYFGTSVIKFPPVQS